MYDKHIFDLDLRFKNVEIKDSYEKEEGSNYVT